MDFYYSIANIILDPNTHHQFLVNDADALEAINVLFNEIESGNSPAANKIFQIRVNHSAEEEFNIDDDYRNLSNEQVYNIIASTEPSEFNRTGYRVDIMSARLLSIFQKSEINGFISVPVTLINPLTGRFWQNYFAVRFTILKDRMKITTEALFVDQKTFGIWFNEKIMKDIAALGLPDIAFTKLLPKKFP